MNPFEFINSINFTKEDIMIDDITEKQYVPFVVNRTLSYFGDTVLLANEMNSAAHIDHRMQYDFYLNTVRKRKRFTKWAKAETKFEKDLECIKEYYGYNDTKAHDALTILTPEQIKVLKEKTSKGGKKR